MLVTLCLAFLLLSAPRASAYIDPGTGSLIIQIIIAGALAVSLSLRIFWKRIKTFFLSLSSRKKHGG